LRAFQDGLFDGGGSGIVKYRRMYRLVRHLIQIHVFGHFTNATAVSLQGELHQFARHRWLVDHVAEATEFANTISMGNCESNCCVDIALALARSRSRLAKFVVTLPCGDGISTKWNSTVSISISPGREFDT
jgi:hypothetical protein